MDKNNFRTFKFEFSWKGKPKKYVTVKARSFWEAAIIFENRVAYAYPEAETKDFNIAIFEED